MKKIILSLVFITLISITVNSSVFGQGSGIQDIWTDYDRVMQTEGLTRVHNVSNQPYRFRYLQQLDSLSAHPWAEINLPYELLLDKPDFKIGMNSPEYRTYWRNLKPGGINDGAVWQGRGFTSSVSSGFYLQYRFLSASIQPILIHNQNRDFELSRYPARDELTEYGSPFYNIDNPQRFGDSSFWTLDPGPSYIKAGVKGFEAGLSNQNRWWGPANHYPIIMSNNAPGFWHYFAGTEEPKDIYIGDLETTIIWGKLMESDYYDNQGYNDERYMTGLNLLYNPGFVDNLTVGFSRVFYRVLPPEGIPVGDLFKTFEALAKVNFSSDSNTGGDDKYSQMLSLHARWVFPESGFEVYGEFAKNDHSWDMRDAIGELEHSRAYMLGFQKTFPITGSDFMSVNAEIVQGEASKTRNFRTDATYYTHYIVRQGYTQRGQIMGVGYDAGSNSQILNSSYYFERGKISGWVRRTVFNNDHLYRSDEMLEQPENAGIQKFWLHNFEVGGGGSVVYFMNNLETELGFELMREFNEDFLYKNDKTHLAIHFRIRYRLSALK